MCIRLKCYLTCSSCRFQPATTLPALPAASSQHPPSLLFLPFRPAPTRPAQPAVPPGTDLTCSSRRPAGISPPAQLPFRRYLTLLLPLPFPAGPYLSTHPAIPEESSPPAFNKLYLNSVKFCLSLRWGPNLKRNCNTMSTFLPD